MSILQLDLSNIASFIPEEAIKSSQKKVQEIKSSLESPAGKYKDYTGWGDLPATISYSLIEDIKLSAEKLRKKLDVLVVIGIGGSYLGAKAVIEALSDTFAPPPVVFAGINLSEEYLLELIKYLTDKEFGICIISKSGTTTEPAISFRVLKNILIKKCGAEEAAKRIIAITDKEKGALKQMSDKLGFKTFAIPSNIGGRFSVLTPVGLYPIAFAGFDINKLLKGARKMYENTTQDDITKNIAVQYAIVRNILLTKGYNIEILVNYNPKLHFLAEWWKQLFGESEGKEARGIFPAAADFSSDLHSLGQYIQDGPRNLFETVINVQQKFDKIIIENDNENLDNLNYLKGKSIEYVNQKAMEGTIQAHVRGGVPNIIINVPKINENTIGQLIYFFEKACGISAMILGVHPFIQPGVEEYKTNMFKLLGKKI